MRAADLAEPFPVVHLEDDALAATQTLAREGLPGLVVVDDDGHPLVVLPASQVLRFALPEYVEEDPRLARLYPEDEADRFFSVLENKTVRELMPSKQFLPKHDGNRPVVGTGDTLIEVASQMSLQHSPVVAVIDEDQTVVGVITVHRLLGAALGSS